MRKLLLRLYSRFVDRGGYQQEFIAIRSNAQGYISIYRLTRNANVVDIAKVAGHKNLKKLWDTFMLLMKERIRLSLIFQK